MTHRLVSALLGAAFALGSFAHLAVLDAAEPAPTLPLDRWIGTWQGSGTNSGVAADLTLRFERALGERFVKVSLLNQIGPVETREKFEGLALYWPAGGGQIRGSWFDSQGTVYALDVQVFGATLLAIWHDEQPRGRSSYRLVQPGVLEVIDSVRAPDGSWREFARYQLKRT
ncbi:MAG TPA: hypothetical protein VKB41_15355 [Steroidobacteraceae bacterium]|jgi:hypothetical protein|nr:hypothetical protein [Steroidobacteraceae bacterium]